MTVRYPTITDEGMPTAEEMEEGNRRARELVALWVWNDNFEENGFLHSEEVGRGEKGVHEDEPLAVPVHRLIGHH